MIEMAMLFGTGDTVKVRASGKAGRVLNTDEDERSYLVVLDGGEKKVWFEEDALEASNITTPMAIEWIDSYGLTRWEYFPAGDIRSAQSARFWVMNMCNVRQIVRAVYDIESYADLVAKYGKK